MFTSSQKSIAIITLCTFFLSGCNFPWNTPEPIPTQKPIPEVNVEITKKTTITPELNISGTVIAQEEITIAAEISGTVSRVYKKEGQKINPGENIMQLGTSDNMLSVTYASAQRSLSSASQLVNLTKQAGTKQIKNAEIAVEKAKIAYNKLKDTKTLSSNSSAATTLSSKKTVEIAEKSLELAKKSLSDLKTNLDKNKINLIENTANGVSSAFVSMKSAIDYVDSLFGISDINKGDNDAYEVYLYGNAPYDTIQGLKDKWKYIEPQINEVKNQFTTINKKTYTKEDESIVLQNASSAIDVLKEIRTLLRMGDEILQYSFNTPQFTQSTIDGLKSNIKGQLQSIESTISTLTGYEQAISDFNITSPQQILNAEIQVSTAESQLASAQSGLDGLKNTETSSNINLESSLQDAQNAIDSANAQLEMTKVQAGVNEQTAIAQLNQAQSNLDSAAFSLSKLSIDASINGTITKILKKDGDSVQAGTPLVVISDVKALKLQGDVSVEESLQLKLGMPAKIKIEGTEKEFVGQVSLIYPEADKVTRRVKIEILIPNAGNIPANTFATAKITLQNAAPQVYIPLSSLISQNPPAVMMVETTPEGKQILVKKEITLGKQKDTLVEVLQGLRPNQMLVSEVYPTLFEGDEISPKIKESIIPTAPNAIPPEKAIVSSQEAPRETSAPAVQQKVPAGFDPAAELPNPSTPTEKDPMEKLFEKQQSS